MRDVTLVILNLLRKKCHIRRLLSLHDLCYNAITYKS